MDSLQQPWQFGTVIRFESLEFMAPGIGYDMVLLSPQHHIDADYRLAQPGGARPRLPPSLRRDIQSTVATLLAGGGGGTTATTPRIALPWLSSLGKLTTQAPLQGTCQPFASSQE
jgi:hypothetical protein